MKMDVSRFKKVSSDKAKTILMHPSGHKIVIAHNAVSPSTRKQLTQLPSHFADGGGTSAEENTASDISSPIDQSQPAPVDNTPVIEQAPENRVQQATDTGTAPPVSDVPQAAVELPTPMANAVPAAQPAQGGAASFYDPSGMVSGINTAIGGEQALAGATGQLGKAQADIAAQNADAFKAMQSDFSKHATDISKNVDSAITDIKNGHINPNHYLENMSAGQKVASAIGLILGGIGGGLTHQGNPAMDFLNKQIERDVQSQVNNLSNKQTLVSAYMHQFGNLRDATDMARATQLGYTASKLEEMAGKSADPMARARAQIAIGPLMQQRAQLQQSVAMRKAFMGPAGQNMEPSTKVRLGVMSGIIPEKESPEIYKQLQTAENMSKSRDALMSAFDQVKKLNTTGNRIFNPIQSSHQIEATWEPVLAQLVKDAEGRVTPTDIPMIGSLKPAATDDEETLRIKHARLNQFVSQKMNFPLLQSYGITPPQGRFNAQGQKTIQMGPPVKK